MICLDCLWTVRSAHVEDAIGIDVVGYSICGTLRGAGGMPSNWNFAEKVVILGHRHSPSKIWMSALGWLSA